MDQEEGLGAPAAEVIHYFDKIKVAVLRANSPLAAGDKVRIIGGEDTDFEQMIESMQVEHNQIDQAKKGDEIGLKVKEKVRDGYKVYLIK